jgi:transposase-like protein
MVAKRGRPRGGRIPVELTAHEREVLLGYTRRRKTAQAIALRSRIVLMCAEGHSNEEVARRLRVNRLTVGRWRRRFLERRLEGLTQVTARRIPAANQSQRLTPDSSTTVFMSDFRMRVLKTR